MFTRRALLRGSTAALLAGLAGCQDQLTNSSQDPDDATDDTAGDDSSTDAEYGPSLAASAQLTTYRARLADAVALGYADRHGLGATVAGEVFENFERADGEYGVHEVLEAADHDAYEGFEHAAIEVKNQLDAGDHHAASDALDEVRATLRTAQTTLVGEPAANALDVLSFGSRAATASVFAAVDEPRVSASIANGVLSDLDSTPALTALQEADADTATAFENAIRGILRAGQRERSDTIRTRVTETLERATTGARVLAPTPGTVGSIATLQTQLHDAFLLARLGGPGRGYAHATTLTAYRARVQDVQWLVDAGATDAAATAATAAISALQHFETSRTHEPLEEGDHEAYEAFETGIVDLQKHADSGDATACAETIASVDETLRAGVEALAPTDAAVLEAGFLRARLADAHERFLAGDHGVAADIAADVFARFERDELGVHEAIEHQSHALYERFERDHLAPLPQSFRNGQTDAAETHVAGAREALLEFEANAGGPALVSGAETAVAVASAFDAAACATTGRGDRAAAIITESFETFEAGTGGFHEALEGADHATYETYEERFFAVRQTTSEGGDVHEAAMRFFDTALDGAYTVVDSAGGQLGPAAAALSRDATASYREGAHSTLAESNQDVASTLDTALDDLETALSSGSEIDDALTTATNACRRAQFALVGALDAVPEPGNERNTNPGLSGGPNVVDGVPEDADHVVQMTATTYEPAELTISTGDTVAFAYAGGEPHTVTAYTDEIPADATYWASGGFENQQAAVEGWSNGTGAVVEDESFVHEFTTTGEHHYYCIPHESLGMTGTIVVEE